MKPLYGKTPQTPQTKIAIRYGLQTVKINHYLILKYVGRKYYQTAGVTKYKKRVLVLSRNNKVRYKAIIREPAFIYKKYYGEDAFNRYYKIKIKEPLTFKVHRRVITGSPSDDRYRSKLSAWRIRDAASQGQGRG